MSSVRYPMTGNRPPTAGLVYWLHEIGGFLLGVIAALAALAALVVVLVVIASLALRDAYWGGFVVGYFVLTPLAAFGPIALIAGGIMGARKARRRHPRFGTERSTPRTPPHYLFRHPPAPHSSIRR